MNKIICDVCGTAYPETAAQCPICGCAKPETDGMPPLEGGEGAAAERSYTYVKGGRFSKSNVRKRNKASGTYREYDPDEDDDYIEQELPPSNKGLIVAIALLIVAILAVVVYIVMNFTGSPAEPVPQASTPAATEQTQPVQTTVPTTEETLPQDLSCTGLTLEESSVVLTEAGQVYLINVTVTPENTEDPITYAAIDPAIATVSKDGRITAVATGTTQITVTCGAQTATLTVECQLPAPGLDPDGKYDIMINKTYVSKAKYGAEATLGPKDTVRLTFWKLAPAGQDDEQLEVEWVIADPSVCTMEGDTVSFVGAGTTTIKVKVGDTVYDEYSFKIICHK